MLCQRTIPSHDKLGISSSTASLLLNFAGRTRNVWVSFLVRSSFGSCFGRGGSGSLCAHFTLPDNLVAHNFTELNSGRADYSYLAFGELSRFVYCLLQKVKLSSDLPVIEKWEAYMLPNHSCFGAISEEHFLEGTRLLASLEKINGSFLRKEFRWDCRRFLEDLLSTILSTVAARSQIGQGLSCFCPEIVIGGDDYSAFHLFGQLLGGLLELGWVRGSEVEPAKAEFHSFVRWRLAVTDLVPQSIACLLSATNPVSVLGGICIRLVFRAPKIL